MITTTTMKKGIEEGKDFKKGVGFLFLFLRGLVDLAEEKKTL
jgi:hypothetical protein